MVKRAAAKAGINEAVSSHWLRHGNIATTPGYLHARPNTSSGLHLDQGVFLRSRRRQWAAIKMLGN